MIVFVFRKQYIMQHVYSKAMQLTLLSEDL